MVDRSNKISLKQFQTYYSPHRNSENGTLRVPTRVTLVNKVNNRYQVGTMTITLPLYHESWSMTVTGHLIQSSAILDLQLFVIEQHAWYCILDRPVSQWYIKTDLILCLQLDTIYFRCAEPEIIPTLLYSVGAYFISDTKWLGGSEPIS